MGHSRALFAVLVGIFLANSIPLSRGCAPSCDAGGVSDGSGSGDGILGVSTTNPKTIQRVMVNSVEEARARGVCHSICINTVRLDWEMG